MTERIYTVQQDDARVFHRTGRFTLTEHGEPAVESSEGIELLTPDAVVTDVTDDTFTVWDHVLTYDQVHDARYVTTTEDADGLPLAQHVEHVPASVPRYIARNRDADQPPKEA